MQHYVKRLEEFIGYKSISTIASHKEDLVKTAHFLKKEFEEHGFSVQLLE
jgi:acetylornithine deacetylase/succinyl-diaminopimelate desuccinylase-like protein